MRCQRRHSSPSEKTPAWRAGLKPNDRIVKINDEIRRYEKDESVRPGIALLAAAGTVLISLGYMEREGLLERGASHSRAIRVMPNAAMRNGMTASLTPQLGQGSNVFPIGNVEIAPGTSTVVKSPRRRKRPWNVPSSFLAMPVSDRRA